MMVIPIVVGEPGTVSKVLEKRLGEQVIRKRIETISSTTLLKSSRILSRVFKTRRDLMSLTILWETCIE